MCGYHNKRLIEAMLMTPQHDFCEDIPKTFYLPPKFLSNSSLGKLKNCQVFMPFSKLETTFVIFCLLPGMQSFSDKGFYSQQNFLLGNSFFFPLFRGEDRNEQCRVASSKCISIHLNH